jgi:uncharacterized protein
LGQPIVHFEIIGQDAPRLHAFYRDLFGWGISPASGPETGHYAMVDAATSGLPGGIGQAPGGNRVMVYVQVPDLEAAIDRATGLGGKVALKPTAVPGGPTIAQIADPDGNLVGLIGFNPAAR